MVTRNTDLFFELADWIEFSPGLYDQETFGMPIEPLAEKPLLRATRDSPTDCGSRHCIAGWAAILSGEAEFGAVKRPHAKGYDYLFFAAKSGREVDPVLTGQRTLGLTDLEADVLFGGGWEPPMNDASDEELNFGPSLHRVAEALRHIGKGEAISEHTEWDEPEDIFALQRSERRRGIPLKGTNA